MGESSTRKSSCCILLFKIGKKKNKDKYLGNIDSRFFCLQREINKIYKLVEDTRKSLFCAWKNVFHFLDERKSEITMIKCSSIELTLTHRQKE